MKFKEGDKVRVIKDMQLSNIIPPSYRRFIIGETGVLSKSYFNFPHFIFETKRGDYTVREDACEEYFEKIEESMKLEKIIPLIRENKKIEFLGFDRNGLQVWKELNLKPDRPRDYCCDILDMSLSELMTLEFRVKKEKEYQALYYYVRCDGIKIFDTTSSFYKSKEEFLDSAMYKAMPGSIFHSLILESERNAE